ncbi:MAG: N-acetylglucosamine-6-phosphate deacetylase [Verrucomicrobia bacterium]|nr:N-acetylglucosamine-6-phosphate deacetylase [Verrucomicrobiota bacterium]
MHHCTVSAWHYATRKPVAIHCADGKITALERATETPPENLWVAPPLFDVQVNGYGGIDYQNDRLTEADLLSSVRQLRRDGCSRILLTLITDDWSRLMAHLQRIKQIRDANPELRKAIVGWHIEGPFLSDKPGFHGAHNPALMCDPTPEQIETLRRITGSDPVLLTLAPERSGSIEAIRLATSLGIKISLGHTNASAETLQQAVEAGATGFTHLGNGCPRELDRHDNILWRVFETPGLIVGVIPDAIHVSGALFRLMHRVLDSIYYTTDAMSAAGAPPGKYPLGNLQLEVGEDQIVRQPGKTNFAGSALRPIDGIFRGAKMLNKPWQSVWPQFTDASANLMGLHSGLEIGDPADFCLLRFREDGTLDSCNLT